MTIDLNCDMGEGYGTYTIGNDEAIMPFISSANIACGFHAGDPSVIMHTIRLAKKHHVAIGAHPGYPDLAGFGRRTMHMSPDELYASMLYQVGALKSMAEALGTTLHHVKPHGALYNDAAKNEDIASAMINAVKDIDNSLLFVGLAQSVMLHAAEKAGLRTLHEFFADRSYNDDGSLVSRQLPGAVIHDTETVLHRVIGMIRTNTVQTMSGKTIPITAHTICIHGDNPHAPEFARMLHERLTAENIRIHAPER